MMDAAFYQTELVKSAYLKKSVYILHLINMLDLVPVVLSACCPYLHCATRCYNSEYGIRGIAKATAVVHALNMFMPG
jgi:hypothetical protein